MEPITLRQNNAFQDAYRGYGDLDRLMETVRKLTKDQATKVISLFHGVTWEGARNSAHPKHMERKMKLRAGLEAMERYGYVPHCSLCNQERTKCCC